MSDRVVRVRLHAEINQYLAGMKQAAGATAEFGRNVSGQGRAARADIERIGASSVVAGGAIAAAFGVAVNSAMGFDKQLSELAAVSSATGDELGQLRQAALDAGAATAFSASEAAQAQTELAKAGVSTADIMGGALTGALDLAAAGGIELGDAATYAANAMTTFGLAGSDVGHIADVLAAGASKSAADVSDIGMALQQSGLVADQFGLSIEESVGVLSAFAQAGLRGSDAGTSLKTALQRLVPQSEEAANLMASLGIEMFDAAGKFVGIDTAAQELQDSLSGLSEEQRNAALTTLFGSDAVRAATILYTEGAEGIGEWIRQVDDAGFASEVASQRLDNLSGDLEALRGSIETALIQGGSQATGALRLLAQGATDAVNAVSSLPGPLQSLIAGLGAASGGGLLTLGAIGTVGPKIRDARASLEAMGTAGQFAARNLNTLTRGLGALGIALAGFTVAQALWNRRMEEGEATAAAFGESVAAGFEGLDYAGTLDKLERLRDARDNLLTMTSVNPLDLDMNADIRAGVDELDRIEDAQARVIAAAREYARVTGVSNAEAFDAIQQSDQLAQILSGELTPSVAGAEAATGRYQVALDEANAALGETKEAAQEAADTLIASFSSALEAQERELRRADIIADLDAMWDSYRNGETSLRDYELAVNDATDAMLAEAAAAVQAYSDQVELQGGTLSATDQMAIFRTKLDEIASTLAPGNPVRANLENYATELAETEGTYTARMDLQTAAATQAATEFQALMTRITETPWKATFTWSSSGTPPPNVEQDFGTVFGLPPGTVGNAGGGYAGTNTWGPTDRIPSLLSPGEFVLSTKGASAFSRAELYGMNQGLRPAGTGGIDTSSLAAALRDLKYGFDVGGITVNNYGSPRDPESVTRELRRMRLLYS